MRNPKTVEELNTWIDINFDVRPSASRAFIEYNPMTFDQWEWPPTAPPDTPTPDGYLRAVFVVYGLAMASGSERTSSLVFFMWTYLKNLLPAANMMGIETPIMFVRRPLSFYDITVDGAVYKAVSLRFSCPQLPKETEQYANRDGMPFPIVEG